jgi:acetate---CoA ligase (ADP-forming)
MTPKQCENLRRLLSPGNAVFIGGNDADFAARQCAEAGFKGPIWGVSPRRETMGGQPCFAMIEELPHPPDIVFLATPKSVAVEAVEALRKADAGGVVCYTAGFGETGAEGAKLEAELIDAAGDMALVGPNCSGLNNFIDDAPLWPFPFKFSHEDRGVAFITQSGMLGNTMTLNQRSVPFAYIISAGNQAVLGIEDYLNVLVDNPTVTAIGLYIEGLRDIPGFTDAALLALEKNIPIVALKAGTSEIGSRLTVTHTGSLSGTDDLYQALFDRLGIIRVTSPIALLETLKLLTVSGAPKGNRIAAFTASGGDCAMIADGGEPRGLLFPQPSEKISKVLTQQLPPIATVSNPLDYTTPLWGHEEPLHDVMTTMFKDGYDAAVIVQDYPVNQSADYLEPYHTDARAFARATREAGIPAAVCTGLSENIDQKTRETLIASGVAPLQGIEETLDALAGAAKYGARREYVMASNSLDDLRLPPVPPMSGNPETLDEWQGKQLIREAGISVPEGRRCDGASAPAAAEEIGFPVVVKLVSALLPHKTEAGAVKIGLQNGMQVAEAVKEIAASVADYAPDVVCEEYLVERMVAKPVAELVVGIQNDPQFGQTLIIGTGGTLVELVRDAKTLLLPTDRQTVSNTVSSLKISMMIDGYRGQAAGDREALIDAIMNLTRFAAANRGKLAELDINPLMVLEQGVCAVDVLMRMR